MRSSELPAKPSRRRFHDRNGTAHRRLEVQGNAVFFGSGGQRDAMPCQQCLVGRDDRFLGRKRRQDGGFGRVTLTADQLHEYVDVRIRGQLGRIGDPAHFAADRRRVSSARARADRNQLEFRTASAVRKRFMLSSSCQPPIPTVPKPATPIRSGATISRREPPRISPPLAGVFREGPTQRQLARGTTLCNFSGAD